MSIPKQWTNEDLGGGERIASFCLQKQVGMATFVFDGNMAFCAVQKKKNPSRVLRLVVLDSKTCCVRMAI